jgi:succinate dehydrogenase / fumarate reductase flavoprotein subunit
MVKHLRCDVLIVGGGAAGSRAALEAHDLDLDVLVVVKGLLGKSGCSIFAGSLDYFASEEAGDTQESIQKTMEFLGKYTHYLGDQEYLLKSTYYHQEEFFPWLEKLGLYILRDEQGAIVTDIPHRTQAWAPKMGMSGATLMSALRRQVFHRRIRLLEETSVTKLLKKDRRVVGAVALDFSQGEIYVIQAKAVVLATGHSNYLSKRSTGTREGAANGWVLAYQAGARLQNLEMQWYHVSDVRQPRAWMRLHLYPNPLPGTSERAQLFNSLGEMFFDGNMYPENPVPYITQLKHLVLQVQAGKARFDGGYYTSYRHVEPEVMDKWLHQTEFFRKLGLDPLRDMFENGVTWHMNVGGVHANGDTLETDLPGLYVAGSVAALITGGLPNTVYDGMTAVRHIRENLSKLGWEDAEPGSEEAEVRRLSELFTTQPEQGLLPAQVKKQIRDVMWEHMGYVKSEKSILDGVAALQRIQAESLPKMRLGTHSKRFNMDWVEAVDVFDMLLACELLMRFSLFRKESRGGFYREDYPVTDNVNWLKHVMGSSENGELRLYTKDVDLAYVWPQREVLDFFAVDY